MIRSEMIAQIMEISEEDDADIVGFYLDNAEEIILNQLYPFDESREALSEVTVPSRYTRFWERLTIYLLAKNGADGESVHIENGIHRHYTATDVPADMLREITPKAVVL